MHRQLTAGLALLGTGVTAAAVLGPLVTGVPEYRTSEPVAVGSGSGLAR
jgi:hypothetical protein